ncbi:MAG: hypothetical protein O2807_05700 [bacterium]|nr:hypothetical protein [bacterium]
MPQVENNSVKYNLNPREHELYGYGVDVYMIEKSGQAQEEPIAFIPGRDADSALLLTRQWLKVAFPAEASGKKK